VVELPAAPVQPWLAPRADANHGELVQQQHRSEILDNERRIWVYTPPGYQADDEPYALLALFDGDVVRGPIPFPTILDNLIDDGRIPPMVAVLVDSLTQEVRNRELPCGAPFLEYLTDELLPWARTQYRITTDPARTIVAGQSHGGQAAAFAGLRRPDVFGNVISQSGSFWWSPDDDHEHEWLTRQYAASERLADALIALSPPQKLEPPIAGGCQLGTMIPRTAIAAAVRKRKVVSNMRPRTRRRPAAVSERATRRRPARPTLPAKMSTPLRQL
jgi:enterochelin esterase family protein